MKSINNQIADLGKVSQLTHGVFGYGSEYRGTKNPEWD